MRELDIVKKIVAIENTEALDPLVEKAGGFWAAILKPRALRDLLHGVPFGHPVHPVSVQVPIGAWTSAAILDLLPGTAATSRLLVGVGAVSAIPAVLAGWADWLQLHEQQKRVGIVHAAANATAVALYAASWIQRGRGKQTSGKVLSYAGLAVVSGAGFLGGHLSFRQASGANHAEAVQHLFPEGWQTLGPIDELLDNELSRMDVAGQPLLVLRRGNSVDVLSNTCSHLAAPLNEGELLGADTDDPCVSCPWHQSVFSMRTGEVVHGPATAPQPKFRTRVIDGFVEVMLPNAG